MSADEEQPSRGRAYLKQLGDSADEMMAAMNGTTVLPMKTGPKLVTTVFEPNERVIAHCEKLLAMAKSGEIRAIGYALVEHDDLKPNGTINWGYTNTPATMFALDAAISALRRKWEDGMTDE